MKPPEPAAAAAAGGNDSPEEIPSALRALEARSERHSHTGEELGTQARRAGVREANQRHRGDSSGQFQAPSNGDTPSQRPHVLADITIGAAESGRGKARRGCFSLQLSPPPPPLPSRDPVQVPGGSLPWSGEQSARRAAAVCRACGEAAAGGASRDTS